MITSTLSRRSGIAPDPQDLAICVARLEARVDALEERRNWIVVAAQRLLTFFTIGEPS